MRPLFLPVGRGDLSEKCSEHLHFNRVGAQTVGLLRHFSSRHILLYRVDVGTQQTVERSAAVGFICLDRAWRFGPHHIRRLLYRVGALSRSRFDGQSRLFNRLIDGQNRLFNRLTDGQLRLYGLFHRSFIVLSGLFGLLGFGRLLLWLFIGPGRFFGMSFALGRRTRHTPGTVKMSRIIAFFESAFNDAS